jgi:hypothetical protein
MDVCISEVRRLALNKSLQIIFPLLKKNFWKGALITCIGKKGHLVWFIREGAS